MGAGHIPAQFAQDFGLRASQLEAEPRQKWLDKPVVAPARQAAGFGGEVPPAELDLPLQRDELVQRQPPPGEVRFSRGVREVQQADGPGARWESRDFGGQRQFRPGLANPAFELPERPPDQRAEPALRHALSQRVNRGEAIEVDEVLLAVFQDFGLRVVHRPRFEVNRLSERDHFLPDREVLLHERQVPPAAMQPRGAVVENQLEDGLGAVLVPLDALGNNPAPRRGRLAELQSGYGVEMAAVFVAGRPMQQQVPDRANLQPGELRGAFRADAEQSRHRVVQGRERFIGGRGGHPRAPYQAAAQTEARNPWRITERAAESSRWPLTRATRAGQHPPADVWRRNASSAAKSAGASAT